MHYEAQVESKTGGYVLNVCGNYYRIFYTPQNANSSDLWHNPSQHLGISSHIHLPPGRLESKM